MAPLPRLACCLLFATVSQLALAQGSPGERTVYRWVDASGQVHYSDRAQPGAQSVQLQRVQPPEQAAKPPVDAAAAEACRTKQQELEDYRRAPRLFERDAFNKEREFTPEERERFLAMRTEEVARLCGGEASAP